MREYTSAQARQRPSDNRLRASDLPTERRSTKNMFVLANIVNPRKRPFAQPSAPAQAQVSSSRKRHNVSAANASQSPRSISIPQQLADFRTDLSVGKRRSSGEGKDKRSTCDARDRRQKASGSVDGERSTCDARDRRQKASRMAEKGEDKRSTCDARDRRQKASGSVEEKRSTCDARDRRQKASKDRKGEEMKEMERREQLTAAEPVARGGCRGRGTPNGVAVERKAEDKRRTCHDARRGQKAVLERKEEGRKGYERWRLGSEVAASTTTPAPKRVSRPRAPRKSSGSRDVLADQAQASAPQPAKPAKAVRFAESVEIIKRPPQDFIAERKVHWPKQCSVKRYHKWIDPELHVHPDPTKESGPIRRWSGNSIWMSRDKQRNFHHNVCDRHCKIAQLEDKRNRRSSKFFLDNGYLPFQYQFDEYGRALYVNNPNVELPAHIQADLNKLPVGMAEEMELFVRDRYRKHRDAQAP